MAERKTFLDRYSIFLAAAVMGAHGITKNNEFRQYDVRNMIEIFTHWATTTEEPSTFTIQNTQVARYLEGLAKEGFARRADNRSFPYYRLTRVGLLELLTRVVGQPYLSPREHFYFVFFFVEAYRSRIIAFVRNVGPRFPYSLQLELETLLNPETLLDKQLEHAQRQLRKLERRIDEHTKIPKLARKLLSEGKGYEDIRNSVDKTFPFSFLDHRRFIDVFSRGTERQGLWEMQVGSAKRTQDIWKPTRELLLCHIKQLKKLKETVLREDQAAVQTE